MRLFWYEKVGLALFTVGAVLVQMTVSSLRGGTLIPPERFMDVQLAIFSIGSVISFMGRAACAPKGAKAARGALMGFMFAGAPFLVFAFAAMVDRMSGTAMLVNLVYSWPMVMLILLSLASFSYHKVRERRWLMFS